jgi:hypothetical protein
VLTGIVIDLGGDRGKNDNGCERCGNSEGGRFSCYDLECMSLLDAGFLGGTDALVVLSYHGTMGCTPFCVALVMR